MSKRVWLSIVALAIGVGMLVSAGFASPASSKSSSGGKHGAKGGTLRVDLTSDFDFIDPALDYFSHGWQMQYATSCKLLSFPIRKPVRAARRSRLRSPRVCPAVSGTARPTRSISRRRSSSPTARRSPRKSFAYAMNRDLQPKMSSPAIDFMARHRGCAGRHGRQGSDRERHQGAQQHEAPDHAHEGRAGLPGPDHDAVLLGSQGRHADQPGRRLGAFEGHGVWSVLRV